MGYSTFKGSPKSLITSDDIGKGQVKLEHLDPGLFAEIQRIALHNHSGAGTRKINIQDLAGYFGISGFYAYSSDGTKKYQITLDSATDDWVITEV